MRWFLPSVWPVQPDPHDGDHQEPQPRARQEEQGQRGERCQRNDRVALAVQEPAGAAGGHGTGRLLRRTSLGQVGEEDAEVSPGRRRPGPGHPQLMFSRVEPPCAPVLAQQRDRFVTLSIADTCGVSLYRRQTRPLRGSRCSRSPSCPSTASRASCGACRMPWHPQPA